MTTVPDTGPARAAAIAVVTSGVVIRELHGAGDIADVDRLYQEIRHPSPANPPVTNELMRVFAHSGNHVVGAFVDDRVVGATVGFALKLHQRAWALDRGLEYITWTFEPLVRRNAYFNLAKLAASALGYLPGFSGEMDDGINGVARATGCRRRGTCGRPRSRRRATGNRRKPARRVSRCGCRRSWAGG
ncbi:hypothetical protein [Actinosynnema sp. NPDC023587]|uniref:hypothetical protein n=1 Tax=Actinosynnema sp. NPDC023587 TaxID=3154695 RepID=UPI00340F9696